MSCLMRCGDPSLANPASLLCSFAVGSFPQVTASLQGIDAHQQVTKQTGEVSGAYGTVITVQKKRPSTQSVESRAGEFDAFSEGTREAPVRYCLVTWESTASYIVGSLTEYPTDIKRSPLQALPPLRFLPALLPPPLRERPHLLRTRPHKLRSLPPAPPLPRPPCQGSCYRAMKSRES